MHGFPSAIHLEHAAPFFCRGDGLELIVTQREDRPADGRGIAAVVHSVAEALEAVR